MNFSSLSLIVSLVVCLTVPQASADVQGFFVDGKGISVEVVCLNEGTIHVKAGKGKESGPGKALVVDDSKFPFSGYEVEKKDGATVLKTDLLLVEYDESTGNISFTDRKSGKPLLKENKRSIKPLLQGFEMSDGEAIYGLGQYQHGKLNYRGRSVTMVQANREIVVPVLVSTKNYLVYWDNYSKTLFSDNEDGAVFQSGEGDGVSYYFVYGKDMADAVAGFRTISGAAPMLPKSAYGLWMSKERYKSFEELVGAAAEFRRRDIPVDNMVQDWQYWGSDRKVWNGLVFDPVNFPNPEENIKRLHDDYHVKLTVSVWPGFGKDTKVYQELDKIGGLLSGQTWGNFKNIDIYNPEAREIFWKNIEKGLLAYGVDGWWMDGAEPSWTDDFDQGQQERDSQSLMTKIGPFSRYLNTYSLELNRMMYEHLRKKDGRRVSILCRSAFAGQQRYSTVTWTGDIYASWDVFRNQIPEGLNYCMTGLPYWTTDIGAFFMKKKDVRKGPNNMGEKNGGGGYAEGLKDPAYLELYTRWFQYGVFCPVFRIHGSEEPREPWHFGDVGDPHYDIQVDMIKLRYSLMSYIYSTAWQVTSRGRTLMCALAMDFTDDKATHDMGHSFMFGDSLLVAPVIRPMYHDRQGKIEPVNTVVDIYLPEHPAKYWYDFNSDQCFRGGGTVAYDAPLEVVPVFVKAGSIVPRNKVVQYANADDNSEMDIIVYSGADASFTLYEDDNETYDYEKGMYSAIDIIWDDVRGILKFSEPKGEFSPCLEKRKFNVKVLYGSPGGTVSASSREVEYDYSACEVEIGGCQTP